MKKIFNQLYDAISYWGIDESVTNPKERDDIILTNQYLIILSVIFLCHGFFSYFTIGFEMTTYLLLGVSSLFFILFVFFIKSVRTNKFTITTIFILLCGIVTYYSSLCGLETGIYLFYFPMLSGIFIFFSWNSDKIIITFLLIFILSNLYIFALSNFHLVEKNTRYVNSTNILLILNIICMLLLLTLNSFFFQIKREDYYFTLKLNLYRKEQIDNLNTEVIRLKKMLDKDIFSKETLKELLESIQLTDTIFVEKFETFFPCFFDKLQNLTEKPLSISDVKMCAMLKLGLTTKQIAIYNNSTIKSVEGKIYRLRKKLNISSKSKSKHWFSML